MLTINEQEQEQEQEIEMEVQKEEVRVEATPMRQNYSREDENPKPFQLESLGKSLATEEQGFSPMSEFCIRTWRGTTGKLPFPLFMQFSRNYYNPAWSLSALKRLKNSMVMIEWCPGRMPANPELSTESLVLNDMAKQELRRAFDLFDMDKSRCLNHRFELLLLCADIRKKFGIEPYHRCQL